MGKVKEFKEIIRGVCVHYEMHDKHYAVYNSRECVLTFSFATDDVQMMCIDVADEEDAKKWARNYIAQYFGEQKEVESTIPLTWDSWDGEIPDEM